MKEEVCWETCISKSLKCSFERMVKQKSVLEQILFEILGEHPASYPNRLYVLYPTIPP